jgi:hypothetical protein
MTMAVFLGGAKGRLLPMSVPLRFFATAAVFHVAMWAALFVGADTLPDFRGGFGPVLAALHLLTLGVLTMTAAGASVQLLPVATRRPIAAVWPIKLLFWILTPGVVVLASGMATANALMLAIGSSLVTLALLLLAVLLGDNLRRSHSLPAVSAYGWAALACLLALIAVALLLIADYQHAIFADHQAAALAHMILAGFGFMGLLALGFSHILVPMFSLSAAPDMRRSYLVLGFAAAALAAGTAGALLNLPPLIAAAAAAGLVTAGLHLAQMRDVLRKGMRKNLGLSFVLVKVSWAMLPLSLLVGLAAVFGLAGRNGATLFGFLLVAGWLLTFLIGILQRILPFLASMHATRVPGQMPPAMSELSMAWPIKAHAACHLAALALIALAILTDLAIIARLGAALGFAGSLAFAWFTGNVIWRTRRPRVAAPAT